MKKQIFLVLLLISNFVLYAQWIQQNSGTDKNLFDVYFTNDKGWAIGNEGIVLHTEDEGNNWDGQSFDPNDYLNGVFFIDSNQGWIAGGPGAGTGIIYNTVNGGVNWEVLYSDTVNLPAPIYFNDVCFTDINNGWVTGYGSYFMAGSYGIIMHTVDGGETWDYQENPADYYVSSVQFLDSLRGWVVGGDIHPSTGHPRCMILSTDNGGSTWTEQINTYNSYPPLKDVFFTDTLNGFAAGYGLILKTSDGGLNWDTSYFYPGYLPLSSIYFTDQLNGWTVGYDGLILSTEDGGDTWLQQNSGTTANLYSVFFTDQDHGWIVGDSGTILSTNNGGITIIEESQTLSSEIQIKYYPNPFSNELTITWIQTELTFTKIGVYNSNGKKVRELVNGMLPKGKQELDWITNHLLPGIYLICLETGNKIEVRKIIKH